MNVIDSWMEVVALGIMAAAVVAIVYLVTKD